jgi:hypothetical protein
MTTSTSTVGTPTTGTVEPLPNGTHVEVWCQFDRRWARGFAVEASAPGAYRVRRISDGTILPAWFPADRVRAA